MADEDKKTEKIDTPEEKKQKMESNVNYFLNNGFADSTIISIDFDKVIIREHSLKRTKENPDYYLNNEQELEKDFKDYFKDDDLVYWQTFFKTAKEKGHKIVINSAQSQQNIDAIMCKVGLQKDQFYDVITKPPGKTKNDLLKEYHNELSEEDKKKYQNIVHYDYEPKECDNFDKNQQNPKIKAIFSGEKGLLYRIENKYILDKEIDNLGVYKRFLGDRVKKIASFFDKVRIYWARLSGRIARFIFGLFTAKDKDKDKTETSPSYLANNLENLASKYKGIPNFTINTNYIAFGRYKKNNPNIIKIAGCYVANFIDMEPKKGTSECFFVSIEGHVMCGYIDKSGKKYVIDNGAMPYCPSLWEKKDLDNAGIELITLESQMTNDRRDWCGISALKAVESIACIHEEMNKKGPDGNHDFSEIKSPELLKNANLMQSIKNDVKASYKQPVITSYKKPVKYIPKSSLNSGLPLSTADNTTNKIYRQRELNKDKNIPDVMQHERT